MDLAKVGEVQTFVAHLPERAVQNEVNEKLAAGWVLVSTKVVESSRHDRPVEPAIVIYVLGKPRKSQPPSKRELTEEECELLTHITDPQHPDHQLIRTIIGKKDMSGVRLRSPEHATRLRIGLELVARVSAKAGVPFPIDMKPEEREAWLKEHLPVGDPDHPLTSPQTIGQVCNYPADEGRGGIPEK